MLEATHLNEAGIGAVLPAANAVGTGILLMMRFRLASSTTVTNLGLNILLI
jgi:hypothetical protein